MRSTLSEKLLAAAAGNPRLVLLTGDHGNDLFQDFRRLYPGQFINAGIAEQNMVGVAAGMARVGYTPVVYALSSFMPSRVMEQIKVDVCHDGLGVKFLGDGAGLVYSYWGSTHQCFEDIALMSVMPGMRVYSPADGAELAWGFDSMLQQPGPAYLRIGKAGLGELDPSGSVGAVGPMRHIRRGDSGICVLCTGPVVHEVLQAIPDDLSVDVHTVAGLKPFDSETFRHVAQRARHVVTVEEHSKFGGLGSIVREAMSANPLPVTSLAIDDRFSATCGSYPHLLGEHGLDAQHIRRRLLIVANAVA